MKINQSIFVESTQCRIVTKNLTDNSMFQTQNDDNSSSSGNDDGSNEDDSDYSDDDNDTDDATICLVTNCPKCGVGKLSRNAKIEKIVKTFHLMMQFRQFLQKV